MTPTEIAPIQLVPFIPNEYRALVPGEFSPVETQDLIQLAFSKFSEESFYNMRLARDGKPTEIALQGLRMFREGILTGDRYETLRQFKLRLRRDGPAQFIRLVEDTYTSHMGQSGRDSRQARLYNERYWTEWRERMYALQPVTLFEAEDWFGAVHAIPANEWAIAS